MSDLERRSGDEKGIGWIPKWIVKIDKESKVGLVKDDGCYLVLVRKLGGGWFPTKWIHPKVIEYISTLERKIPHSGGGIVKETLWTYKSNYLRALERCNTKSEIIKRNSAILSDFIYYIENYENIPSSEAGR